MKRYTKAFIGSVVTFVVGTSCCWLSTLAIWLGGATVVGFLVEWIEDLQIVLLVLSAFFAVGAFYLYKKKRKNP